MKNKSLVGQILMILTILCPFSFCISMAVGDVAYFEKAGMLKYAWIMLIFLVIPIATIVITIILEIRGYRHFENYVISAIMVIILLACGSLSFVFKDYYSYDNDRVAIVESKTKIDLPEKIDVASLYVENQNLSYWETYIRVNDESENSSFVNTIKNSEIWVESLDQSIKDLFETSLSEIGYYDYYVFFNATTQEYNRLPQNGENDCVIIAYDTELKKIYIRSDLILTI